MNCMAWVVGIPVQEAGLQARSFRLGKLSGLELSQCQQQREPFADIRRDVENGNEVDRLQAAFASLVNELGTGLGIAGILEGAARRAQVPELDQGDRSTCSSPSCRQPLRLG